MFDRRRAATFASCGFVVNFPYSFSIAEGNIMTTELYYLLMSAILTAVLWIPYILGVIQANGLMTPAYYDAPSTAPLPNWVQRANRAHQNAVENIGPFAAIVLVAHLAGVHTGLTATAAAVYFFARI